MTPKIVTFFKIVTPFSASRKCHYNEWAQYLYNNNIRQFSESLILIITFQFILSRHRRVESRYYQYFSAQDSIGSIFSNYSTRNLSEHFWSQKYQLFLSVSHKVHISIVPIRFTHWFSARAENRLFLMDTFVNFGP